jgi:lipopolysaccharide export system protein LptA
VLVAARPLSAQFTPGPSGDDPSSLRRSAIQFPIPDIESAITVRADRAARWDQGGYEVWLLSGNCRVGQDTIGVSSREMVVWIERQGVFGARRSKVITYAEGNVVLTARRGESADRLEDRAWFGRFYSTAPVELDLPRPDAEPTEKPPVWEHGLAYLDPGDTVRRVQFDQPIPGPAPEDVLPEGVRRIRIFPRSTVRPDVRWFPGPDGTQNIACLTGGVNILVDGLGGMGTLDLSTDRAVIWTTADAIDLSAGTLEARELPLEIYLEGNVVFRQGDRVIFADQVVYDVKNEAGSVINADLLTPAPGYAGLIRLRADVVQALGRDRFLAERAFATSSRMGFPTYRIQAGAIYLEDRQIPRVDPFTREPDVDPETGEPIIDHEQRVTSRNNTLFLGPVPVFYWPVLSADVTDPVFYIRRLQVRKDNIFGTRVETSWSAYELLGINNPPEGTDLLVDVDYLSERGIAGGGTFEYDRANLWGLPGNYAGFLNAWGVDDSGHDNLGLDRRFILPEEDFRYRVFGRHRQLLPYDWQLSAEVGLISDRNFLEQYYENEWDEFKDQTTGLELKRVFHNSSMAVSADYRTNDFFTQTEWLPRGDHFLLGQNLLGDRLTWYEHTTVGYGRLRTASFPDNPVDAAKFVPRPWEATATGERIVTRHEIDLPLSAGPVEVTPYVLGEFAHWGEDLTGNDLQRAYGQAGIRASLPLWTANPTIESRLFNVHGIAHKVTLEGEIAYADSNRDLAELPLYDPLDDDSTEHFRRRFAVNTFGGAIPAPFDERLYALRSGLGSSVTSPVPEIADDLTALRMGLLQRWQTRRGPPDAPRIIDWIVLDADAVWFPEDARDNFGESFGLVNYDFRWHVGDRVTLLSNGSFDFFVSGQNVVTFGAQLTRPGRGSLFIGYRQLEGPFQSQVLLSSLDYRLGPKWIAAFGASYDISGTGNIGESFSLTRVGESFLVSVGVTADTSKDNLSVNFALEPRVFSLGRIRRGAAAPVGPAGLIGLE